MAAIAFDPLEYSRLLEGAGVPRDQAEVHARAMTTAFLHNVDALVTKDYLDTRFTEFETRFEVKLDRRIAESEARTDKRFAEMDKRFTEVAKQFAAIDVRFEHIDGQFGKVYVMLAISIASTVIPALQNWLA